MDTVQRLSYIHTTVDQIRLRYVYRKLRDIALPRSQRLLRILADGPLSVTEIERAMYHDGDTYITQSVASQFITILVRYGLIIRIYPKDEPASRHYYALRHHHLRRIQQALDRFNGRLPPLG